MAYRIVAKSPEKLDDILTDIKEWFSTTKDYVSKFETEKRKFADPATKQIVSKDIDVIYVKDMTTKKETKIMLIPLLKPGEMKVEMGGENEHVMKGKIKNMMKGRGEFKTYNKDTLRKMEAVETLRNIVREEIKRIIKQG
jgi:protein subunit release factor A